MLFRNKQNNMLVPVNSYLNGPSLKVNLIVYILNLFLEFYV